MHFSRFTAILVRQFYLYRGSPARIMSLFAWIAIDIVLWGFISRYLNTSLRRASILSRHCSVPSFCGTSSLA